MKILCALSGIEYRCDHFPGYLSSRESYHPIFDMSQKSLLKYMHKWAHNELTDIDNYLLYLALFNSTGLLKWHSPARQNLRTKSLVAAHMESLVRAIDKINLVSHPSFVLHHIAITNDTADFSASPIWIDNWHASYAAFCQGYKDEVKHDKIARKERHMDILMDKPDLNIEKLGRIIADWASIVGEFPNSLTIVNNQRISISDYWKSIIIRCAKSEGVFAIPESDLSELYDHCQDCSELHGSTHGRTLMTILRSGLKKLDDPFDLNTIDFDLKHPGFVILSKHQVNDTEAANLASMIALAPDKLPLESEIGSIYPSKIAYLRAKFRWEAAEKDRVNKEEIANLTNLSAIPDILDPLEQNIEDSNEDSNETHDMESDNNSDDETSDNDDGDSNG